MSFPSSAIAVSAEVVRRASGAPELSTRRVRELVERMLAELRLERSELGVLLTGDRQMRVLNREHRGKDRATDVLAFPIDGRRRLPKGAPRVLGDVVISIDTAARQARGRRRPLLDEMRLLLAHGIAHLIGFDHATRAQKARMDAITRRLIRASRAAEAPPTAGIRASRARSPDRPQPRQGRKPRAGSRRPSSRRTER